jgi:hypothetical protein
MYLNTTLVFSLMWAVWTLELGLLATLKSYMSHHVLLVSITSLTCHALEIFLSSMMCHHSIIQNYWHEWELHIYTRNSLLPGPSDISILSVRMATNMMKIRVLFKFYRVKMPKFTLFQFCNKTVLFC